MISVILSEAKDPDKFHFKMDTMTPAPIVALAGNPNSGKTTIFNSLTGLNYKVANYPGVTVEKKEGRAVLDGGSEITVIDLPGMYSLSGSALDETIAASALLGLVPDEAPPTALVAVVDASNFERNLYLATQLIDLGLPVVIALSMSDIAERWGIVIRKEILVRALGCPVVSLSAKKSRGVKDLRDEVAKVLETREAPAGRYAWAKGSEVYLREALKAGAHPSSPVANAGDEVKILFGSALLSEAIGLRSPDLQSQLKSQRLLLGDYGIDSHSFEASRRYAWINDLCKRCVVEGELSQARLTAKIDAIAMHRVFGFLVFFLLMAFVFQSIFMWAALPMSLIDSGMTALGNWVSHLLPASMIRSLLVDGVIAGVGSVLVFIPQIAILFFFIGLLEESGYLARAAFLMDRVMRKFGLQGRSFIPLLSSFACAIPGIMSTRTIPSFSDRLATILIAPLMSCSARLPVYAVMIGAFIPAVYVGPLSLQGLVLFGLYLLGIVSAGIVAWILKATVLKGEPTLFVMEMPPYRMPGFQAVLRNVWDRIVLFVKSAGTVILAISLVLWFLSTFPGDDITHSFAGMIGKLIEPLIQPLGYNWEIAIALLASFAAREVFVGALATVYNLADSSDSVMSLTDHLKRQYASGLFSLPTAISLLVFYVFACQCMSTLAVCRRETGSWKWPAFMFAYMLVLAYVGALLAYHLTGLFA